MKFFSIFQFQLEHNLASNLWVQCIQHNFAKMAVPPNPNSKLLLIETFKIYIIFFRNLMKHVIEILKSKFRLIWPIFHKWKKISFLYFSGILRTKVSSISSSLGTRESTKCTRHNNMRWHFRALNIKLHPQSILLSKNFQNHRDDEKLPPVNFTIDLITF